MHDARGRRHKFLDVHRLHRAAGRRIRAANRVIAGTRRAIVDARALLEELQEIRRAIVANGADAPPGCVAAERRMREYETDFRARLRETSARRTRRRILARPDVIPRVGVFRTGSQIIESTEAVDG